ncbi:MAG: tetratricopeptide repeat protein [Candidatus Sericytochromatia bacterium]
MPKQQSVSKFSNRSNRAVVAALCLLSLFGAPVLAQPLGSAEGTAISCASLDDCMKKGQAAETTDQALDYISKGIDTWKEGDSQADLSLATLIRGQVYLQYYTEVEDTRLLDLAERDFVRVTQLSPASYEGFAGLAMVAANRGLFDETEEWFAKGFSVDPKDPYAYQERAAYYYARKNFAGVVKDLSTALALIGPQRPATASTNSDPDDADVSDKQRVMIHLLRAYAYMELGKEIEARSDLAEACRLGETRACQ